MCDRHKYEIVFTAESSFDKGTILTFTKGGAPSRRESRNLLKSVKGMAEIYGYKAIRVFMRRSSDNAQVR